MKSCFKCGGRKALSEFYRHPMMKDGHLNKCKTCTKRDISLHYYANWERLRKKDNERKNTPGRRRQAAESLRRQRQRKPSWARAARATSKAIMSGRLVKAPCERCGTTTRVQAHHNDYTKPLEVRWLCWVHHMEAHGKRALAS